MKRSLSTKEIAFILLPALGLGTFAFYQRRIEQVGAKRRSDGIYVSSIGVKRAKGRFQAEALSHEVTVSIAHSWPRPSWWGSWKMVTGIDPLGDIHKQEKLFGMAPKDTLAYGAVLTTTSLQNGKPTTKKLWRDNRIGYQRQGNEIVFSHNVALDRIPLSAGEVTFRGLYVITGQEPLWVTRVIRKAGEKSYQPPDRSTNGNLVSVQAGNFYKQQTPPATTPTDAIQIDFLGSRPLAKAEKLHVQAGGLELQDANHKTLVPFRTPGFTMSWGGVPIEDSGLNTAKQTIWLSLAPTLKTTNPLTLKGKVYLDDGWPIPFSVRLPKR